MVRNLMKEFGNVEQNGISNICRIVDSQVHDVENLQEQLTKRDGDLEEKQK